MVAAMAAVPAGDVVSVTASRARMAGPDVGALLDVAAGCDDADQGES
jgi:hypothetical protein